MRKYEEIEERIVFLKAKMQETNGSRAYNNYLQRKIALEWVIGEEKTGHQKRMEQLKANPWNR